MVYSKFSGRSPLWLSPLSTAPSVRPLLVQGARSRPLPLPGPFGPPSPGHPAAPTGNVCHVVWELAVEKRVSTLKAAPTHARTCVPQGVWLPHRLLSQARPEVGDEGARNALWRLVLGAGGSGTCFFPNPGPHVSALGSQIQDPGSGSRIGTRPARGASQKARGLHRRAAPLLRRERAGGLRWLLQPLGWVTMAASYAWDISKKSSLR